MIHRIHRSLTGLPRRAGVALMAAAVLAWMADTALGQTAPRAQEWPKGPIVFVAPFSPGGGGDTLARAFASQLAVALGAPVIVENRPGAGGNLGTASVARATPDGQTLVFGTMGTMGTNHALYKKPGFGIDDFEPVAMFGSTALALVVGPNSALRSMQDVVAAGRQHPGQLSCASGGNGTVSHVACALLQQLTGAQFNHVPYKASPAAYIDLMTDRVSFMIDVIPPLAPQISGGKLRALAVSTRQRLPAWPDTPPMADTVPGYELASWDGLFAPKGTPSERLDRLHDAVSVALASPDFAKAMADRGYALSILPRKDFAAFVRKEHARIGAVVRQIGITLD